MSDTAVSASPSAQAAPRLYTRRSSGLVREISATEALVGGIAVFNLPIAAVTLMTLPFAFPGANMTLTVLLSLIPAVLLSAVYLLFGIAMPRSGGDYVFNSRALHPAIGFAANFSFAIWNFMFVGISANWLSTIGLSGLFGSLGTITGAHHWNTLATDTSKHWVVFVIGVVALAFAGVVLLNLRLALRVMKVCFYIAVVTVIASIIATLFTSRSGFEHTINHVASYNGIISQGQKAGFTKPHSWIEFSPTISGVALLALSTLFTMFATYTGGEVKNVRRSLPISIYGTLAVGGLIFTLMAIAASKTWGHSFVGASQALATSPKYPFSTAPNFNFFASIETGSTFWAVVFNVGVMLMLIANMIFSTLTMARCVFAWAMDRVIPDRVASISSRTHSPVWTIVIAIVISGVGLVIFTYTSFSTFLGGLTLGFLATFITTSIAAIVFPYRRPELYAQSPVKLSVGGVPLLSIMGALSLIVVGAIAYAYFSNSHYGANSARAYAVFIGAWVVGLAYYGIVRLVRSRQGVPLALSGTSLPPD
jgi:amino acid transporter